MTMERGRGVTNRLFTTTCISPTFLNLIFNVRVEILLVPSNRIYRYDFFLLFDYSERR